MVEKLIEMMLIFCWDAIKTLLLQCLIDFAKDMWHSFAMQAG